MAQRVDFTFNDDGSVSIEPVGYRGKSCLDATRPYEEVLGVPSSVEREITNDMRLSPVAGTAAKVGPGGVGR